MSAQSANFAYFLVEASRNLGSLLDVAEVLEVEPQQVFRWIAEMERPLPAQAMQMERRLRMVAFT